MTDLTSSRTVKGERGFELDMHLTFAQPVPRAEAEAIAAQFVGLAPDLYGRHDDPSGMVPSLRLTGPWADAAALQALLGRLLGEVRVAEVGKRGFLRSANGQMEWMPWRRNVVLSREKLAELRLEEGIHYILES